MQTQRTSAARSIRRSVTTLAGVAAIALAAVGCSTASAGGATSGSARVAVSAPGATADRLPAASAAPTPAPSGPAPASSSPGPSSPAPTRPTSTDEAPSSTTPSSAAPSTTPSTTAPSTPVLLKVGSQGPDVKKLQTMLNTLGYWNGTADGTFGELTRQAVMAYQSAAGIGVDGVAGEQTIGAIARKVVPQPRTTAGDAIEIDKSKQIVMVVVGGELEYVFHTSTGSGETYRQKNVTEPQVASTPSGEFAIERAIDGNRISPLGELWRPRYFVGGIALHGSPSVPNYPASHGCVRLTNETIDFVWSQNLAPIGRTVLVY